MANRTILANLFFQLFCSNQAFNITEQFEYLDKQDQDAFVYETLSRLVVNGSAPAECFENKPPSTNLSHVCLIEQNERLDEILFNVVPYWLLVIFILEVVNVSIAFYYNNRQKKLENRQKLSENDIVGDQQKATTQFPLMHCTINVARPESS